MSEVLIVDDDPNMRELLKLWLAEGYTLTEVENAESAIPVLASKPIGVVMIDKDMPGEGGLWLVEQIQKSHPAVAMLLATGDDQIPPRVSLSRGIQGYLVKPFKRELVAQAVSDAMAWHSVAAKSTAQKQAGADPVDAWLQGRAGRPPKDEGQ